jgi:hypothetical protein
LDLLTFGSQSLRSDPLVVDGERLEILVGEGEGEGAATTGTAGLRACHGVFFPDLGSRS